ncbi:GDSL-type esterase/lipase family protein [Kribbella sp. NBC_01505]|uniref:SGNH/GDSL hydrolase family protein n=1 Tax=Kribbella sp. NBC_01505 TaxID=2903580 RepID=UPI003863DE72
MTSVSFPSNLVRIEFPSGLVRIEGAQDLERTAAGIRPRRLPAWTRRYDAGLELAVSMAAGVRLRLRTAAREIALGVHVRVMAGSPASFDLVLDGSVLARETAVHGDTFVVPSSTLIPGAAETIRFTGLPAGEKTLEIWLPHTAVVELRTISASDVFLPPEPAGSPRWIHYGSSISHGMQAPAPTLTWPAIAALRTGTSLVDLGFAGNAMLDPDVARTIAEIPADLITLKIGANLVITAAMLERTFVPAVHNFLDLIRAGHPTTPIALISPISLPALETQPGPARIDPTTGSIRGSAVPGALSMTRVRELLAGITAVRADPALRLVDGRELLGPSDVDLLADGIHPDAAGHLLIGDRATKLLLGGGPVPGGVEGGRWA